MLTSAQKETIQAIVNLFESGTSRGDYACIAAVEGDRGGLSYGRAQASLKSGALHRLIDSYCADDTALYAKALSPYLSSLAARDPALTADKTLHALLSHAGGDPAMRRAQDAFFDRHYWYPALSEAAAMRIQTALGTLTVYDSLVHGSWMRLQAAASLNFGTPWSVGEQPWIARYVETRKRWLLGHANALLRKTVYRMETLEALIAVGNWDLSPPVTVRGRTLNMAFA